MYKKLLVIAFSSFLVTACGGGGSSSSSGTNGGGTNNGGNNGGGTDGGGGTVVGGQSGSFGDSADAANGIAGTFNVCPDSAPGSFSSFTQDGGGNWCVKRCPAGVAIENDDGDPWGRYNDGGDLLVCRDENVNPGSQIAIDIFAPINGCPDGGCPTNSFPQVYGSAAAGAELAGTYTCTAWLFDQVTQVWGTQSSPAPFSVTLNADASNSATVDGTPTTWSFANGVLTLEGSRTLTNVAVGSSSFTSYDSNTALTRCAS